MFVLFASVICTFLSVHGARRDAWRISDCSNGDCEERDKEMKSFIAAHVPHDLEHNGGKLTCMIIPYDWHKPYLHTSLSHSFVGLFPFLALHVSVYILTDAPFDEHLMGLRQVIRKWGAGQVMEDAAALHSIYGTQGFAGFKLSVTQRSKVRDFIGSKAERLVCILKDTSYNPSTWSRNMYF